MPTSASSLKEVATSFFADRPGVWDGSVAVAAAAAPLPVVAVPRRGAPPGAVASVPEIDAAATSFAAAADDVADDACWELPP